VTVMFDGVNSPVMQLDEAQTNDGYHNLSHHGKSEDKLGQLKAIDTYHFRLLDELLTKLKEVTEDGEPLLDRTMILFGTNFGNADAHVNTNLPGLIAGG